ncbi:Hypothetical protein R9X50_00015500 [Acrodontium crateriforme]|uniref:Rab-GAP TBC domain-containing protein n=1 Tax=Acrodontium crateriforme TaxID=150365 RepID=A0AAQ3R1V5_9PEZI|nr:Hypothetical protein R9X50_00015500 [Acrodontium crateriforme]
MIGPENNLKSAHKSVRDETAPGSAVRMSIPRTSSEAEKDKASGPFSASIHDKILSQAERDKLKSILKACNEHNLKELQSLATSKGGLLRDDIRQTAWPILLGCGVKTEKSDLDWRSLDEHRDEEQVQLDVNRSFVYYPEGETGSRKDARKSELSHVITTVLRQHRTLHYFQGYHDIVQVLLLVLGADAAIPAVARLSLLRIRDFMLPTMVGTEPHLQLVPAILYATDPQLCQHLSQTQPFFALAATLTLYAHDIEEYGDIARLFDFLLAHEAAMSLYLFAVIVMSRKKELLEIEPEEPEMLHSILSKLPKPLNLDGLISRAVEIYEQYPPDKLPCRVWSHVSLNSVLKTTRNIEVLHQQTLKDGEEFFKKQAEEIKRAEAWNARKQRMLLVARNYKRPVALTGIAILVAVFALALRNTSLRSTLTQFSPILANWHHRTGEILQRFSAYIRM